MLNKKSFTIVEFIIILALVAGISSLIYFQIKPQQYFQLARDSKRINDLKNLSLILDTLYLEDQNLETGLSTNTIYISLSDAATNCQSWLSQLPSLPNNFNYRCSSNPTLANGQGWFPIDFTTSSRSKLIKVNSLPLDPLNKPPYYYSFVVGGSYKLTAKPETNYGPSANDNGFDPLLYEIGSDLKLSTFQSGLVGYWNFDEGTGTTAKDLSGFGNNGTLYSSTTICSNPPTSGCPQWTIGKVGGALSFDGANDYVDINDNPGSSSPRTIIAYVKNFPISGRRDIINVRRNFFNIQNNKICFFIGGLNTSYLCSSQTFNSSTDWNFVAATYKDGVEKVYINGSLVGVMNVSGNPQTNISDDAIGVCSYCGMLSFFSGLIDEVRVYNRDLSESEIKALYEATK
jgi:hypothetical protein